MYLRERTGGALSYLTVEPDGYEPGRSHPTVVLLHGLGDSMVGLVGLAPAIDDQRYLYAFPNAPLKVRLGNGAEGFAWTASVDGLGDETLERSADKLCKFFDELMDEYGLLPGGLVLGGFSQGGMMAYRCGLPEPEKFRGIAALSSRIPDPEALQTRLPDSRSQPIFMSHGTHDTMIPLEDGRRSRLYLEQHGYAPEYREYEMGHEMTLEVLVDLKKWLAGALPAEGLSDGAC